MTTGDSTTEQDKQEAERDVLIEDYRTILTELGLLTTVSVLLFGFLLATRFPDGGAQEWVYAVAVVLVASSTMVFILPVAYHHVQFPYEDFPKFILRSHYWIRVGLPPLAIGLYLSLCLAIWSLFDGLALFISALPFLATAIAFLFRKGQL